jgi:hypothetical protein
MLRVTHTFLGLAALALSSTGALAASFVNGSFEDGTASGWTTGTGYRGSTPNSSLIPSNVLPGGSLYTGPGTRSGVVGTDYVDPNVGAALGSTVYSGNYAFRAEDTTSGGYASAISQTVTNYTDSSIFFAWKAVLENGGHTADESALLRITLRDDTTGTDLVTRTYNAGATGGGVDNRFSSQGDLFYTASWQIEEFNIDAMLSGHTFTLSLLAADCEPTGHTGYAYLDGFGAVLPPPPTGVPEPASLGLFGLGLLGLGFVRRRTASKAA